MEHDKFPVKLLSIAEVCKLLGVGRTSAYNLINSGALRVVKIGKRTLIPISDVAAIADLPRVISSSCD